jgi:hypothetical protein
LLPDPAWAPRQSTKDWRSGLEYNDDSQLVIPSEVQAQLIEKATQTEPTSNAYIDAVTQTSDENVTELTSNYSLSYLSRSRSQDKTSFNSTSKLARLSNKESDRSVASGGVVCSWRRSRLPWERQKEAATYCPMALGDHGVNGDLCITVPQDAGNRSARSSATLDERSSDTFIQEPTPCLPALTPIKCMRCNAIIDSTHENFDGQGQLNSRPVDANTNPNIAQPYPLCQPCSQSVYTAYVVPPNRECPSGLGDLKPPNQEIRELDRLPEPACVDEDDKHYDDKFHDDKPRDDKIGEKSEAFFQKVGYSIMRSSQGKRVRDPVKRPSTSQTRPGYVLPSQEMEQYEDYLQSIQSRASRHIHWPHSQCQDVPGQHSDPRRQFAGSRYYTSSSSKHKHQSKPHQSYSMHPAPISASNSSTSSPQKTQKTTNQKIFDGLQVATAAACDKDLDAWLMEVNGTGVRHFLANLSKFEPLGVNALSNVAKRAARNRREQLRLWEKVREEKLKDRLQEIQIERHTRDDKNVHRGLEIETDGPKDVEGAMWILEDSGLKKDGKGGYCLRNEGIAKDD